MIEKKQEAKCIYTPGCVRVIFDKVLVSETIKTGKNFVLAQVIMYGAVV